LWTPPVVNGLPGIEENYISIYPNPATDQLTIITSQAAGHTGVIRVFNLHGQELIHEKWNGGDKTILNLSHLSSGHYLVRLDSEKGTYANSLVIIE
ncbi:MAG: hypothetical protein ACI959_000958, partial [Limisphaerales bacterium]